MSDMSTMNRESKKRQLRRQMIDTASRRSGSGHDSSGQEPDGGRKGHPKQKTRRRLTWVLALLILTAGGLLGWYQYQKYYRYTGYKVNWETKLTEGSFVGYETFAGNVLKYTRDGASYLDGSGKTVWPLSYEMRTPIVAVNGNYAAIADQQGNSIYICNKDGNQGVATTVLPITKVTISGTGVVAALLEDSTASYITFFKKDGKPLDIMIKTKLSGDGYPMDIALSPDGTQLICSYTYIKAGEMKNRVVFYDFSEIGKNVPNRLVAGFDEAFENTLVMRVCYLKDSFACAFSGDAITFFTTENLASPDIIKQIPLEEQVQSVLYSDEYVGVIVRTNSGEYPNRVEIYRSDGELAMKREFHYDYLQAEIDGDVLLLYNEDSCRIFNMAGVEKLSATFDFTVSKIRKGKLPGTLVVTGPQVMKEIKMQ